MNIKYVLQRINSKDRVVMSDSDVSYTCGRGKENQILCPSMLVSRNHCIFIIKSDGLYLRDLNSSNGVFVNGEKKTKESHTLLKENDKIGIGVPELNPTENNLFVYSLITEQGSNVDNAENVANNSSSELKIKKEEPGNSSCENKVDKSTLGKKRPCEVENGNSSKKQKTEKSTSAVKENGADPKPSTSFANIPSAEVNPVKLEDDDIQISEVVSLAGKNSPLAAESVGSSKANKSLNKSHSHDSRQINNHQSSTSKLVISKSPKEEPTTGYSQINTICISSDEEDDEHCVFPCSQLFSDFNKEHDIKKESEEIQKNEIKDSPNQEVIVLSDSDEEENNPWFNRLYNSQVYRPSQDFFIKSDPDEEIVETDAAEEFGLQSLYPKYDEEKSDSLESLEKNEILQVEELDDDVWDETIQSQQTASQEAHWEKIIKEPVQHKKSSSKQNAEIPRKKKVRRIVVSSDESSENEFSEVEKDMMSALEVSDSDNETPTIIECRQKDVGEKHKEDKILQKVKKHNELEKGKQGDFPNKMCFKNVDDKIKVKGSKHRSSQGTKEKYESSHKEKNHHEVERRRDSKDEKERQERYQVYLKDKKRRNSSSDNNGIQKVFAEERKTFKVPTEKKERQHNFKDERRKNIDSESFRISVEENREKRQVTSEDRRKTIDSESFGSFLDENREKRQIVSEDRRKTIDTENFRKSLEEYRGNRQVASEDRRKPIDSESFRTSLEEIKEKRQVTSEDRQMKRTSEYFENRGRKKKNWEDELLNIDEKTASIKTKQPARRAIVIEAPHMTKIEKRGHKLTVSRQNDNSNTINISNEATSAERNQELQNEDSKIVTPRKRRKSISRKSQENFLNETDQEAVSNNKEIRKAIIKEKLKEISAKRSFPETNSNIVPHRKSKGIAKVTHKSRQDSLLYEQQQTSSMKPGIAHHRKTSPIAHCSKFIPESSNVSVDNNSFNKRDERIHEQEIEFKKRKVDIENCVNSKLTDVTNKVNVINKTNCDKNSRKSCLVLGHFNKTKTKKKVRFAEERNKTLIYEIDSKNSLHRVVGKDAPMNRNKSQAESQTDEYLSRIFEWNPEWLTQQRNLSYEPPVVRNEHLRKMQTHYSSYTEYSDVLRPLLLLEIWNALTKEAECEEKRAKFQKRYCSVVSNSITKNVTSNGECHTNMLIEFLITKEDFDKELYPGPGHLLIFQNPFYKVEVDKNGANSKNLMFHWIFAYVKSKSHTEIRSNTRFNRMLTKATPNAEILVTLFVLSKNAIEPATDTICVIRGAMYFKSNMREILALQRLSNSPLRSSVLFPKLEDYQLPSAQHCPLVTKDNLNERQMEAVMRVSAAALTEKPQISLIHGPPGTGKSKVIVNIIAQILSKNTNAQILVCAPSNAAVDELALRLLEIRSRLNLKTTIKMVRVGRTEAMNPKVKNISLTELGRKQVEVEYSVNKKDENAINEIMSEKSKLEALLNLVEERIENIKRNGVKGDLNQLYKQRQKFQKSLKIINVKIDQRVDFKKLSPGEKNKIHRETEELVLSKATVFACTLSSCYSVMMEKIFGGKEGIKNPICIVDEATQCCEPENLIPLMLGVKKMILVGDTNQLPATVLSRTAKKMGLDQSLFARIQKTFKNENISPVLELNVQYRMDYPILSWPNTYFYKGKLIDQATVKEVPYSSYRVLNLNSLQDEIKFSNTNEADFVSKIISIMVTAVDVSSFKEPLTIGVITPYQNQRHLVLSKINSRLENVSSNRRNKFLIEVNTVDSFQGQERDVIIMSCVRSNGIGFMSDKQRLCVALTRAKSSLILCGNFKTFEKFEMWKELITNAKNRGILIDVDVNAPVSEIKNHVLR